MQCYSGKWYVIRAKLPLTLNFASNFFTTFITLCFKPSSNAHFHHIESPPSTALAFIPSLTRTALLSLWPSAGMRQFALRALEWHRQLPTRELTICRYQQAGLPEYRDEVAITSPSPTPQLASISNSPHLSE
ncbi:hypothetical protein FPRO05_12113 [Fusarium proliferatum]|uniref:Uncharacterized protein n=1 Tax=Gibberella intermedia TaxID=948311 RepID=A0A365N5C7_GIBIN|nr:hypothetical protein FPRO05_12113 [Fusarium proliferatum]